MDKADSELATLILEYLTSRGYLQTVATFQTESKSRQSQSMPAQTDSLQQEFLVAFECGERSAFFSLWNQNVPQETLERDLTCQNLEFSLSVYFAVYPIRTGTGDKATSLQEFTDYLESRGAVLAQSEELATYCALPYVPDLSRHPSFRKLLTESWTSELKARLIQFLRLSLPGGPSTPRLLTMYLTSKTSPSGDSQAEAHLLRVQLAECQRQYGQRLTEIQNSYHTLVGIAMELLDALESAIAGRMITPEYIQSICTRLFGSSLSLPPPDPQRPATQATSLLRQSVMSMRDSVQAPLTLTSTFPTSTPLPEAHSSSPPSLPHPLTNSTITSPPMAPSHTDEEVGELDFGRVKGDLCSANDRKKALLLQALRWRLTRSLTPTQRNSVVESYISNDLLGCTTRDTYHTHISSLLMSPSALVQEQTCRLLNTFSSLSPGRRYLSQSLSLVGALCTQLMEEGDEGEGGGEEEERGQLRESNAMKNALGAVQKLSLRRPLQTLMIEAGLPRWVVGVLGEGEAVSEYTLRYSLALLMNLCLRSAGKRACVPDGSTALRSLGELLEHEDQEICSYVNGILYSLLTVPELRTEARALGMGDMLSSALQGSPPELQSQLKYIITQLNSDAPPTTEESGDVGEEEEEEEEPDTLEGDEDESPIATSGLVGEALLVHYHAGSSRKGLGTNSTSSRKLLDAPHVRPVTPQSRPQSVAGHPERDPGQQVKRSATAAR